MDAVLIYITLDGKRIPLSGLELENKLDLMGCPVAIVRQVETPDGVEQTIEIENEWVADLMMATILPYEEDTKSARIVRGDRMWELLDGR